LNVYKLALTATLLLAAFQLRSEENTEAVLKLLSVPLNAPDKRSKAVGQIAALKPPPVALLIQVLEKSAKGDSLLATRALARIGAPSVQPLMEALKRNEKIINAYEALRDIGPDANAAIDLLTGILLKSPTSGHREKAAEALGYILTDQQNAIATLNGHLKQEADEEVVLAIENALLNIQLRARPFPKQSSPDELSQSLRAAILSDNPMMLLKLHHPYCINYLSPKKLHAFLNNEFAAIKQNTTSVSIREFKADNETTFLEEPTKTIVLDGKAEKPGAFNTHRFAIGAHEGKWFIIRKDEPEK